MVVFDWSSIIIDFTTAFEDIFSPTSKKAHFDNVPQDYKVVDGARSKWSNLILLDAIIFLLENQEFNNASRRAFNQHQVLHECIMKEYHKDENNVNNNNNLSLDMIDEVSLINLQYPWSEMKDLQDLLLNDPTAKSKGKYLSIIDQLTNHNTISRYEYSFDLIIRTMITKVLLSQQQKHQNSQVYKVKRAYHITKVRKVSNKNIYKPKSSSQTNKKKKNKLDLNVFDNNNDNNNDDDDDNDDTCSSSSENDSCSSHRRYSKFINYNVLHQYQPNDHNAYKSYKKSLKLVNSSHNYRMSSNSHVGYDILQQIVKQPMNTHNKTNNHMKHQDTMISINNDINNNISTMLVDVVTDPLLSTDDEHHNHLLSTDDDNFLFDPKLFENPSEPFIKNEKSVAYTTNNHNNLHTTTINNTATTNSNNLSINNNNRYVKSQIKVFDYVDQQQPQQQDDSTWDVMDDWWILNNNQTEQLSKLRITFCSDLTSLDKSSIDDNKMLISNCKYNQHVNNNKCNLESLYHNNDNKRKNANQNYHVLTTNNTTSLSLSSSSLSLRDDLDTMHNNHQHSSLDDYPPCSCSEFVPFPIEITNECKQHSIYSQRREFGHSLSIDYDGCKDNYHHQNRIIISTDNNNINKLNYIIKDNASTNLSNNIWKKRQLFPNNISNIFATSNQNPIKISKQS